MKKITLLWPKALTLTVLLSTLMLCFSLTSCDDLEDVAKEENHIDEVETSRLLINCEGLFNLNNSTLALYDFKKDTLIPDYFSATNKRGLGDTSNDMALYGSKLYIIVNVSSQLEILDVNTGESLKQIPFFNDKGEARQPRTLAFHDNKAYVCCFDGYTAQIDTTSMTIEKMVQCGRNPDGITVCNDKLYVSNSGGLDFPNYDTTVSVINLSTFKEIKKIKVNTNPYTLGHDNFNNVYLVCRGNYSEEDYSFIRISAVTDEVVETYNTINPLNFTIVQDTIYMYNYDFTTKTRWVKRFDCVNNEMIEGNFIPEATELQTPYGLDVDPYNGDVYITEAYNFTEGGDVLCFDHEGQFKYRINNVGLNPNTVIALP